MSDGREERKEQEERRKWEEERRKRDDDRDRDWERDGDRERRDSRAVESRERGGDEFFASGCSDYGPMIAGRGLGTTDTPGCEMGLVL